jgi:opacity protein-like surface antigen
MQKSLLLAAVALAAVASPVAAEPYVGVSGGVLFPRDNNLNLSLDPALVGPNVVLNDAIGIDYKRGYDFDVNLGYDFGLVRIEGELGYKRAKLDNIEVSPATLTALRTEFGQTFNAETDLDLDGRTTVRSAMANALIDFGGENGGIGFFAGGGAGRARVKFAGERDSTWAYQLLAGLRAPVSDNIDVGLKYRYFRTGKLDFFADQALFSDVDSSVFNQGNQRFRSHSVLATLNFNFGGSSPPAPIAEPMAAPIEAAPPPPPQTQTCPDGSVVLATDACPVPPPPPPPPPAAPERG